MTASTHILLVTILCVFTTFGCAIEGINDLFPQDDAATEVDADSHTDVDDDSDTNTDPDPGAENGLTGVYFNDIRLTDKAFERTDQSINFDWGEGPPGAGVDRDSFSVRWTGSIVPQYTETYTLTTASDDGVRLWINGKRLISNWTLHSLEEDNGTINLEAGKLYAVKLEYYDKAINAVIKLYWSSPSQLKEIIPASAFFNVYDECPEDPNKTLAGKCGCGQEEGTCQGADNLWIVTFPIEHSDSSLLLFPDGKTMMIDASTEGKCKSIIIPFLRAHGIDKLDYFIGTHSHLDHVGGVGPLKDAGIINDSTWHKGPFDLKIGQEFEHSGSYWYISNAEGSGNSGSVSIVIKYNKFLYSHSGDEGRQPQIRLMKDRPDLFPVHIRYMAHHCHMADSDPDYLRMLNSYVYICPSYPTNPDLKRLEELRKIVNSVDRFQELAFQTKYYIFRVSSGSDWEYFSFESLDDCNIDFNRL